jgi:hypothetical protein
MTTPASLIPPLRFKSWLSTGIPNAFGTLTSYAAGSVTPLATFTDSTATQQNLNPLLLNSRGEGSIWTPPNVAYKFVEADSFGNIFNTTDQVVNSTLTTLYGGVDTGTVNAYQLSFTGPYSALANGIVIYWIASNTNTGNSTLAITVNGVALGGAIPILNQNGTQLGSGQIMAGGVTAVIYYNGTWLLTSSTGSIPTAGSFLGTLNGTTGGGGSTNPATCTYAINGNIASLFLPFMSVTVGAGGIVFMSGLPTVLQPATQVQTFTVSLASGGGFTPPCLAQVTPGSGNIVFFSNFPTQAWTGSCTIGAHVGFANFGQSVIYGLN